MHSYIIGDWLRITNHGKLTGEKGEVIAVADYRIQILLMTGKKPWVHVSGVDLVSGVEALSFILDMENNVVLLTEDDAE